MSGITAGELRLTGGPGFGRILDFSMREYPGEHSRAELTGTMEASEGGTSGFPWLAENSPVEIHVDGVERALYNGIIQKAESREENGYCLLRLELCSGSILLDLKKEKRSFQDVSMTCGQIIRKAAAESGMTVLCPEELDRKPVGFPVIQYRETDWEFIRRLASRHGLPVYPEPTMGGGKLCAGLPETGTVKPMSCLGYTVRMDRKFYQAGGEQEERERRQYRTCEVRSLDLFRVGDLAEWDGKQLPVCAREARMQGGHLEFTYVLADRSWTWQRRLGNPKISGMSLLGTVKRCAGETVQLELDIDSGRPGQPCYPWTWVPTTGNLMYMMPQAGTRVSLYFKGDEEESALAVNCIRSGEGCKEADPLDKSLTTEHGMQMRLCRCDMGVVTLKEKVLLDDLTGICMEGSGGLHILAAGEVKLEGQEVNLNGNRGVTMYEGKAVPDLEKLLDAEDGAVLPEVVVTAAGKVELSTEEGEDTVQNRGEKVTYYLAWEHADLSHPSNRYRDEPEQKDYDWAQWRLNIAAGMVVVGSVTILGAVVAGAAAGAGMIAAGNISAGSAAASVGGAVFLTGSLYVAEQAVSDAVSGRLGDTEKYVRKALAGSVVGFLTGASGLMMQGASLGKVLSLGFGEGFLGSAAAQGLLNEDGEINWALVIGDGMFSAVMAGLVWNNNSLYGDITNNGKNAIGEFNEGLIYLPNQKIDVERLPGAEGMKIPRRLTVEEMSYLTEEYGVEFSLVYRLGSGKNGSGGQYWLYSGIENRVKIPVGSDVIAIYHTHPKGSVGASDADRRIMKLLEEYGSPQRSSQIIPVGGNGTARFNKNGTYTQIQ